MAKRLIVVLGVMASNPYAGIAWQCMQYALGLRRLGHDVYYFEITSAWPYDPEQRSPMDDSSYALGYLTMVANAFGLTGRWAYRRGYSDGEWFGLARTRAEQILDDADAVLNISGATAVTTEGLNGNLVLVGTDPVVEEVRIASGNEDTIRHVAAHRASFTFGENIGTPRSPLTPLPNLVGPTRQPVLLDYWRTNSPPTRDVFTTVGSWHQGGTDLVFRGEKYFWSKDREFLKFVDLPRLVESPIELATTLDDAGELEAMPTPSGSRRDGSTCNTRKLLDSKGWLLTNSLQLTRDPWPYHDYVQSSKGEFTVAKDANVRLRTGWFSDRSACYLAAGRPVITQDTGFGDVIPTGRGLFAFQTMDDIVAAFEAIESDYDRHSRAARELAEEYFKAESVLNLMLNDLGL